MVVIWKEWSKGKPVSRLAYEFFVRPAEILNVIRYIQTNVLDRGATLEYARLTADNGQEAADKWLTDYLDSIQALSAKARRIPGGTNIYSRGLWVDVVRTASENA